MNKTSVDFLTEYFNRLMKFEEAALKKRVEVKFKAETKKMVANGVISKEDLDVAFGKLGLKKDKLAASSRLKTFASQDPCSHSVVTRSSC